MNYRALAITFLCLFFSGILWTAARTNQGAASPTNGALAHAMTGPQESLSESPVPLHHYTIIGSSGTIAGYIFFTEDLAPEVHGYGGKIPLAIKVDPAGRIQAIQILPHNETQAYTGNLDSFVQQFIGKRPTDPLELKKDIDAIAGATISGEAITQTLKKSLTVFAEKILASPNAAAPAPRQLPWDKLAFSLIVFVLCLAAILTASARLRWIAMLAGFAYFGIMTATMLSIVQIANIGLLNIPNLTANPLWWLTILFAFAASLLIGRAHCASVCPFALVQEALHKLLRRRKTASKIDARLDHQSRYLKYFFLFTILTATFLLGNAAAANIEPFVTLFRGHGTKLAWSFLILMLILSIFHFRFWCIYFCPVGALTGLAARASIFKIKPAIPCSLCKTCLAVCPVQAISYKTAVDKEPPVKKASALPLQSGAQPGTGQLKPSAGQIIVDESECILCGRCIKGCPEGKLSLRIRNEKT